MTSVETPFLSRLVRFQSELNRLDERLEICAKEGNSVAQSTAMRLASVAETLSTLADEFRAHAPEHSILANALGADAIEAAKFAGRLKLMYTQGNTYGGYWGTVLDRPIVNVQAAVDVLIAGAAAALPKKVTP